MTSHAIAPSRRRRARPDDPRQISLLPAPDRSHLDAANDAGRAGMAQAAAGAGDGFVDLAKTYVLGYLVQHKQASGEQLTDACKEAGIRPANDDRAFGAVLSALSREKAIRRAGNCQRAKGHGTAGGIVWELSA